LEKNCGNIISSANLTFMIFKLTRTFYSFIWKYTFWN